MPDFVRSRPHPGWLLLFVVFFLTLPAALRAETRIGGTVSGETRWDKSGSPYIVSEDILVPKGSTLTIGPGVTLRFKENIADQSGTNWFDLELIVEGTLKIEGAEADTVYLTSDATRPTWQDWQGIVVRGGDARADIRGAHIEYSVEGIRCTDGEVVLHDSSIQFCDQAGVHCINGRGVLDGLSETRIGNFGGTAIGVWLDTGSRVDIRNSFIVGVQNGLSYSRGSSGYLGYTVITLSTSNGLMIRNSDPEVTHTTVSGNEYGVVLTAGATPSLKANNFFKNGVADVWLREYRDKIVKIDLSGNFWGTEDLAEIEEQVLDGVDNPNEKAYAILEPFLQSAVSTDSSVDEGKP